MKLCTWILLALSLFAAAAPLPIAFAGQQTASLVTPFSQTLSSYQGVTQGVAGSTNQFSSGYPLELSLEAFVESLRPGPYATNVTVELYSSDAPHAFVRQVFPLPPANVSGDRVVVPISLNYSLPTTVDSVFTRIVGEGQSDYFRFWGKLAQTGTILDAPVVKLPNLVVPYGTTQVQGVATVSGDVHKIAGLEFPFQVANGGPDNIPPAETIEPIAISAMETQFPGSVFSGRNVFQRHPNAAARSGRSEIFPGEFQIAYSETLINAGEPYASIDGTDLPLLQFTLTLHDLQPGIYPLATKFPSMQGAFLLDDSADNAIVDSVHVMDGSIIVLPRPSALVPEPSTIVLAGMAAICIAGLSCAGGRRGWTTKATSTART
jgi:hypothetical protein